MKATNSKELKDIMRFVGYRYVHYKKILNVAKLFKATEININTKGK